MFAAAQCLCQCRRFMVMKATNTVVHPFHTLHTHLFSALVYNNGFYFNCSLLILFMCILHIAVIDCVCGCVCMRVCGYYDVKHLTSGIRPKANRVMSKRQVFSTLIDIVPLIENLFTLRSCAALFNKMSLIHYFQNQSKAKEIEEPERDTRHISKGGTMNGSVIVSNKSCTNGHNKGPASQQQHHPIISDTGRAVVLNGNGAPRNGRRSPTPETTPNENEYDVTRMREDEFERLAVYIVPDVPCERGSSNRAEKTLPRSLTLKPSLVLSTPSATVS